mmetsp:Transcript_3206/g.9731  ORF Transcript_3206/g.9731 Transcript_3206/m.9731 type:complete len:476 (-) Transcript_3206:162-1589(-)
MDASGHGAFPDKGSLFVKNTFLEFVDVHKAGSDTDETLHSSMARAHSDPAMYERNLQVEQAAERSAIALVNEPCEFELDGLSDSEEVQTVAAESSFGAHGGKPVWPTQSDESTNSSATNLALPSPPSTSAGTDANSWQDLAVLLRENARLSHENQMLRQKAGKVGGTQVQSDVASGSKDFTVVPGNRFEKASDVQQEEGASPQAWAQSSVPVPPGTWCLMPQYDPSACWDGWDGYGVNPCIGWPGMDPMAMQYGGWDGSGMGAASSQGAAVGSSSRRRQKKEGSGGGGKVVEGATDLPVEGDERTTVMLRNLPNNYNREMLLAMLDGDGFLGCYDFVYLPIDFKTQACLGYAFVNLVEPSTVPRFWSAFDGFCKWVLPSKKVCSVTWSGPHQGRDAHIERYRNSPVMHSGLPDHCKPAVFENGKRIDFPTPSKTPRAPRIRNYGKSGVAGSSGGGSRGGRSAGGWGGEGGGEVEG